MYVVTEKTLATDLISKRSVYLKDLNTGNSLGLNWKINKIKLLRETTGAEQITETKRFGNNLHSKWLQEHYQILKASDVNNSD